uniref:PAZ domain-containing protein n=1 Tax=Meloidogyne enterolobii TaxID=390850 RepID=A0A6V7VZW6_MELEN|nr:unnamed protein product [Meloidogyne enterolobii]
MQTLLHEIALILNCTPDNVKKRLIFKKDSEFVIEKLKGKELYTTYSDRNGNKNMIYCNGITILGAHQVKAFGNLNHLFNVSVAAYFFAHHGIRINFPYHQCIIQRIKNKKNAKFTLKYYPFELLQLGQPPHPSLLPLPDFDIHNTPNIRFTLGTESTESTSSVENFEEDKSDCLSDSKGILWLYNKNNKLWDKRDVWMTKNKID